MCRKSHRDNKDGDWCTELGRDPSKWDTKCPLRPPDDFHLHEKVSEFIETIQSFCESFCKEKAKLEDVINTAQHDKLRKWYVEHGQMAGRHRAKIIAQALPQISIAAPISVDKNCRLKKNKEDNKLQQEILDRDHYHCRYCGNKLIDKVVWEKLARIANSDQFKLFNHKLIRPKQDEKKNAGNEDVPGLFFFTCPTIDHVIPCSHGGRKIKDNLVSSCYMCNFGKQQHTCEQLGIEDPFRRQPTEEKWDGLSGLIPTLQDIINDLEEQGHIPRIERRKK